MDLPARPEPRRKKGRPAPVTLQEKEKALLRSWGLLAAAAAEKVRATRAALGSSTVLEEQAESAPLRPPPAAGSGCT
jgi:hypothetical protein